MYVRATSMVIKKKGKRKPAWHSLGMTSIFFKTLVKIEQRNWGEKGEKNEKNGRPKSERAGCRTNMSGDISTVSKKHQY